jgi:hypothetical protein
MKDAREDARESLQLLVGASAATLLLWYLPLVGVLVYPLRLFVTFVHELGHALGALVTFGMPHEILVHWDGSGLTMWSGGVRLVAQAAGYVGTPLVGAALLLLAARRRTVRPALLAVGGVLVAATLLLAGNLLAWVAGLAFGAVLIALGLKAGPRAARFWLSFLAVQCMLNAVADLKTLFVFSAGHPEIATDAQLMAEATGGLVPAIVWTVLWSALALAVLAGTLRAYYNLIVVRPPVGGAPGDRLLSWEQL